MGLFDWLKKKRTEKDAGGAAADEIAQFGDHALLLGQWVRIKAPWELDELFLGHVYLDHDAGLSAKGGPESEPNLAEQPDHTLRLPLGPAEPLTEEEVQQRQLPTPPDWITFYGEQPAADAAWRSDPHAARALSPELSG